VGQIKKVLDIIETFDGLPDGQFKESIADDINEMKIIVAELESFRKQLNYLEKEHEQTRKKEIS
tara:strand:+ start:2275 stop:2466 length:192 start_codon:yes stop_codon:yes gene_type:complete